jgi:hypothetical protein
MNDGSNQLAHRAMTGSNQQAPAESADMEREQAWRHAAMESGGWLPDANGFPRMTASRATHADDICARLRKTDVRHTQVSEDWEEYETISRIIPAERIKVEAADEIERLRRALAAPTPVEPAPDSTAMFEFIKHGDAAHQDWLRRACEAFVRGEPRPAVEPGNPANRAEPDCWAILTPNGSKLVSPDEAKGRKDAYPLYAHPAGAQGGKPEAVDEPRGFATLYALGFKRDEDYFVRDEYGECEEVIHFDTIAALLAGSAGDPAKGERA